MFRVRVEKDDAGVFEGIIAPEGTVMDWEKMTALIDDAGLEKAAVLLRKGAVERVHCLGDEMTGATVTVELAG